jgi:TolB protein
MTHRFGIRVAQAVATAFLAACGGGSDSTAPTGPGILEINVVTSGVDIDSDGFALVIDNAAPVSISANGTSSITIGTGSHSLAVDGLAVNCDVTSAPTTANVASQATTRVDIGASCVAFLRNAIVFVSDEFGFGELMVMRPDGSRRSRLTSDQVLYFAPAVSPDGQTIAVASFVGAFSEGIFLLDRFGKGRAKLVFRSNFDGSPAWSPDGTRVAFRSDYPGPTGADHSRIFIVNRDGSGLRQLTPETPSYTTDDGPAWSPDGTQIVFSQLNTLYLVKPDGTGLTSTGVGGHHPAWSPDGSQIAFEFNGIFVMDRSFNQHQLTSAADYGARWSPDGRQLVFGRVESGKSQLYRINADGTGLTKLSTSPHGDADPSWSPTA